jgi:hypothetical protein
MMKLVSNWGDIRNNLETLDRYRISVDPKEKDFYKDRILRGICFVVYKKGGEILWGPSRFVGYKGNTLSLHSANEDKDGKETNPVISTIIGHPPEADKKLEQSYQKHCRSLGFQPWRNGQFGVRRRYWAAP